MLYGKIPELEKPVARLVQGTVMIRSSTLEDSFRLLDEVYAAGGNTFDTAQSYAAGDCERTFGRWMNERGLRDKVVIIDKGAHPSVDRVRVTPFDISSDIHDSLARLKTDHIDIYLLHRDNPEVPVGPLLETLNEHHAAGRIKIFGGSNWTHRRLEEVNEYAAKRNLVPFSVSSPNLSLAPPAKPPWPGCVSISGDTAAQAWYAANQMPLFTWSSLASGFFSGRFRRDNLHTFTEPFDKVCVEAYCVESNFERLERARELAGQKGLTLPQIALAYVLSQPLNIFAITGCMTGAEFRENMAVLSARLTAAEMAWLERGEAV